MSITQLIYNISKTGIEFAIINYLVEIRFIIKPIIMKLNKIYCLNWREINEPAFHIC